jgi:hypothetical protein
VALWFLYWVLRRLLELAVLRFRSVREKEIEILLLRHQLRVLERQVARPQLTQADRALLAAFSRVMSRQAWRRSAFVTPATLLLAPRARCTPLDIRASGRWSPSDVGRGAVAGGAPRA